MSKKQKSQIVIIVPNGVNVKVIRKRNHNSNRKIKTANPYYWNSQLSGGCDEPLVERDFEG